MKRVILILIWLIITIVFAHAEVRAVWVTPWDLDTPAKCDKVIQKMKTAHQNQILAEVRYRSDALYIPNKTDNTYPNPDPRCYIVKDPSFDALQYLIDHAKPENIEVHAWLVIMAACTIHTSLQSRDHLYFQHPEWFTWGTNGRMREAEGSMGIFIDPGIPQVQEYLVNVVRDIVVNYPELDGIHLDYIRYPGRQYGKNPTAVELYRNETDVDTPQAWQNWRRQQINHIVERMYAEIKSLSPGMQLTAAVIANYSEAYNDYAQDWKQWLDGGYIDRVYLMAYTVNDLTMDKLLQKTLSFNHKDKTVIGLRAWVESGYYPISKILSKLYLVRDYGFAGNALFSFQGLCQNGYWNDLIEGYYTKDADIPSLPTQTQNIIFGYVTDTDSIPYASATLRINETGVETRSDINGYYAFTNLPEGYFHMDVETDGITMHLDNLKVDNSKPVTKQNIVLKPETVASLPAPAVADTMSVSLVSGGTDKQTEAELISKPESILDFTINTLADTAGVVIIIRNPCEQLITWYVEDTKGKVLYSKQNNYSQGEIVESWRGYTAEGNVLPTGIYKIVAVAESNNEQVYKSVFLNRKTN